MPITPRGFFSLLIYFLLTPDPDWSGFAQVFELYNQSCHERKGLFNFWYSALPQAGDAKSVFISALNRSTQRLQAFGLLPGEILAAGSWRTGSQWFRRRHPGSSASVFTGLVFDEHGWHSQYRTPALCLVSI
jgi:hypothetical protein